MYVPFEDMLANLLTKVVPHRIWDTLHKAIVSDVDKKEQENTSGFDQCMGKIYCNIIGSLTPINLIAIIR